jgi:hypothetical protein
MSLRAPGLSSRWFARPLILGVSVVLTLFSAGGFLGLQHWHERQAASLSLEHGRQVLDTLDQLRANVADLESEWRGYLLTLDPTYLNCAGGSDQDGSLGGQRAGLARIYLGARSALLQKRPTLQDTQHAYRDRSAQPGGTALPGNVCDGPRWK